VFYAVQVRRNLETIEFVTLRGPATVTEVVGRAQGHWLAQGQSGARDWTVSVGDVLVGTGEVELSPGATLALRLADGTSRRFRADDEEPRTLGFKDPSSKFEA
jgi:hypothetical protein